MKENWEYIALGECFPTIKNGANIKQISGAMGFPITRIETLSGGVFNRDRMGYANITDLTQYCDYVLESGDLLLSHINSKAYIGRTVEYKKEGDEKIIHGMNLLRLRSNSNVINSTLFVYFTKSSCFKDAVARIRKDAVNQSSVAISDLRKIKVPVPPREEQEKIVAELDLLSDVIDKQKAELRELDNLAQSTFYDMFGDPIENPKGWEVNVFGNVCDIICGQDYKSVQDENGEYPVYGSGGIMTRANSYRCPENSVILGRKGNINNPIFVREKFWNVDTAFGIVARPTLNPLYLFFFCKNYDFNRHNVAVTIPSLRRIDILQIGIPVPPISLQQEFADKITSIEKQKAALTQSIAETQKLLDYTMDKYFG